MSLRGRKIPAYSLHKASGQAVVRIQGRDHYLGVFGSPESHSRYSALIAESLARSPSPDAPVRSSSPPAEPTQLLGLTIAQVLLPPSRLRGTANCWRPQAGTDHGSGNRTGAAG